MRIGKVDGQIVKRVRKNSNGTTQVQPVKVNTETGKLENNGEQFVVPSSKFIKGHL